MRRTSSSRSTSAAAPPPTRTRSWVAATTVAPGTYTVSEFAVPGFVAGYGGHCNAQGEVSPAVGASKTCVVTNTQNTATVTVNKDYVGGGSEPAVSVTLACTTGSVVAP